MYLIFLFFFWWTERAVILQSARIKKTLSWQLKHRPSNKENREMRENGVNTLRENAGMEKKRTTNSQGESSEPFTASVRSKREAVIHGRRGEDGERKSDSPRNLFTATAKNSLRTGRVIEGRERGDGGRKGECDWMLAAAQIISVSVTRPLHCPLLQHLSVMSALCARVSSDRLRRTPRSRCCNNEGPGAQQNSVWCVFMKYYWI